MPVLFNTLHYEMWSLLATFGKRFAGISEDPHYDVIVGLGDSANRWIKMAYQEFQDSPDERLRQKVADDLRKRIRMPRQRDEQAMEEVKEELETQSKELRKNLAFLEEQAPVGGTDPRACAALDEEKTNMKRQLQHNYEQVKRIDNEGQQLKKSIDKALKEINKLEVSKKLENIPAELEEYYFVVRVAVPNYERDERYIEWTQKKRDGRVLSQDQKLVLDVWSLAVDTLVTRLRELRKDTSEAIAYSYDIGVFIANPNRNNLDTLGIYIKDRYPPQILLNQYGFENFLELSNSNGFPTGIPAGENANADMDRWKLKADYMWHVDLHEVVHILVFGHGEDFSSLQNSLITHSVFDKFKFDMMVPKLVQRVADRYGVPREVQCSVTGLETKTSERKREPKTLPRSETAPELGTLSLPIAKLDLGEPFWRDSTSTIRHLNSAKACLGLEDESGAREKLVSALGLCRPFSGAQGASIVKLQDYLDEAPNQPKLKVLATVVKLFDFARSALTHQDPTYAVQAIETALEILRL